MGTSWGELYYDHYLKYLKEPSSVRKHIQESDKPKIQILEFANVFDKCTTLCSLGLSHYEKDIDIISEACLVTDFDPVTSSMVFANTLFYLVQNKIQIGRGVSITGIDRIAQKFSSNTRKNALYFTTPFCFPDGFDIVKSADIAVEGFVYLSFFISEKEHEFFVENGTDAFESMLEENEVDPFNVKRPSLL